MFKVLYLYRNKDDEIIISLDNSVIVITTLQTTTLNGLVKRTVHSHT